MAHASERGTGTMRRALTDPARADSLSAPSGSPSSSPSPSVSGLSVSTTTSPTSPRVSEAGHARLAKVYRQPVLADASLPSPTSSPSPSPSSSSGNLASSPSLSPPTAATATAGAGGASGAGGGGDGGAAVGGASARAPGLRKAQSQEVLESAAITARPPPLRHVKSYAELGPRSAFIDAVYKRNLKKVDKYLKRGEVSAQDLLREEDGDTALAWALRQSTSDLALKLLRLGWDWAWRDLHGRDYIALAVLAGWERAVAHLLAQRHLHDWARGHREGVDCALHVAARRGSLELLALLLSERVFAPHVRGAHLQTVLHIAVAQARVDLASEVLRHSGCDVNARDEWGETALLVAAREGRVPLLRVLVEHGADANIANRDLVSPLMVYLRGSHALEGLDLLVEAGADVNARDKKGWPCLHLAAINANAQFVLRLLEYWARPDDKDTVSGSTALHIAVHKGDMASAQALVNAGADINEREGLTGDTPLRISVRASREALVRYLLELGAAHGDMLSDHALMEAASPKIKELLQLAEDGTDTPDLLFMPRESVYDAPQIRAATVEQLVVRATYEKHPDINFLKVFLLTYRAVMQPEQLLAALEARWFTPPPESLSSGAALQQWVSASQTAIRLRVINVMKRWLEDHPRDFESPGVATSVMNFAHTIKSFNVASGKKIEQVIANIKANALRALELPFQRLAELQLTTAPAPVRTLKFLSIDPALLGQQISMMENEYFQRLMPKEFLNAAWTRGADEAPNVLALSALSTRLSYLIATEILSHAELAVRVECLTRALKLAQFLLEHSDFNGMLAVIGGLEHSAVHRLKKTWAAIGDKYLQLSKKLSEIGASNKNYAALRKLIVTAHPPKMPYLGIYLKDVLQIEELPLYIKNEVPGRAELVNFNKLRLTANIILNLQMFQLNPYTFVTDEALMLFLVDYPALTDDNQLFELSRKLEPRT